jgi:hypothetical protein
LIDYRAKGNWLLTLLCAVGWIEILADSLQEMKPYLPMGMSRMLVEIFYNAVAIDHLRYQNRTYDYYYAIVKNYVNALTISSLF